MPRNSEIFTKDFQNNIQWQFVCLLSMGEAMGQHWKNVDEIYILLYRDMHATQ